MAARFAIAAVIALGHFYISYMLLNYAYALGDASQPAPVFVKIGMVVTGAPLVWLAYAVSFFCRSMGRDILLSAYRFDANQLSLLWLAPRARSYVPLSTCGARNLTNR